MREYKIHARCNKTSSIVDRNIELRNFDCAYLAGINIIKQLNTNEDSEYELLGVYEILYNVEKYKSITKRSKNA